MARTFLVSDASINSYRCRVFLSGGDTTAFESNPVMLYMHERGRVIGKWTNLKRDGDNLFADPVFNLKDQKPLGGADIGQQVEDGFLNAASIGIVILRAEYNETLDCYDILEWRLQEISIVDVGANANALQLYDQAGEPIHELKLAQYLQTFRAQTADAPTANVPDPTQTEIRVPELQTPHPPHMELKQMALSMGLPETATEAQVTAKAAELLGASTELAAIKNQLAAAKTKEAKDLVDAAFSDKRISEPQKAVWEGLFKSDHDGAKAALATIPKPANLTQFAQQGAAAGAQGGGSEKADKAKRYHEMDRAGTLAKFRAENLAEFEDLYEAAFDGKPDKMGK